MACDHKRIKSVNCRYFCMDCGDEVPEVFVFGQKPVKNTDNEQKTGKSTTKKRAAKTPAKTA